MTPLNTIIEEEKEALYKCSFLEEETNRVISLTVAEERLTTAMQRAYEAGREERDTYWKERVYNVVSEWVMHNAKTIQHNNGETEYVEVRELLTLLDNLK